ncbi:hypothetical protein [Amycolatopsis sp. H20-H5]|uniref:hypothetical protein n=1 Tax=Amycolatopsis sp. H20-H5 TaxID=3046309 RepID=UPI002DB76ED0|nr:hypothetical protein [Amycolatopsis sp. H20-H5]MEC3975794.1 hypothetical protein [Amycolatopsis sp. H20-H5]
MTQPATAVPTGSGSNSPAVVQVVTVIMGIVVGLTFLFGFGNVLNLALRLGVPTWVAPLAAPAVDLTILGLLLGSRQLALAGATPAQLRPARRLLIFASAVTLALNMADPIVAGQNGKAAFDAVRPLLLIGWAEVGPNLLRALTNTLKPSDSVRRTDALFADEPTTAGHTASESCRDTKPNSAPADRQSSPATFSMLGDDLLERARRADARHWDEHRRPISADTLHRTLRIDTARSRLLVAIIRADSRQRSAPYEMAARVKG